MKPTQGVLLVAISTVLSVALGDQARAAGGYAHVKKDEVGVATAATAAVKLQSEKTKTEVKLVEVLTAAADAGKGMNVKYRLCLEVATTSQKTPFAVVLISVDQYTNYTLTSWTEGPCPMPDGTGDYGAVDASEPGVGLAADNAVTLRAKKTKVEHKLIAVVGAETIEGPGMNMKFRLCLKVESRRRKEPFTATALVSVDQYSNYKLTRWTDAACGGK